MDLVQRLIATHARRSAIFHDRGWPWFRMILTGLVLCRGLVLLCVIPPFEAWDEYQHVGYVAYMAETGERPLLGQANVPVKLLSRLNSFPQSQSALRQLSGWGVVDYATYWSRHGRGEQLAPAAPSPAPVPLYQAQHGPLYYRLATALFNLLGGVADLRLTIGGLRLVNLLLTAASVWIALGLVNRLIRDKRLVALCGLLIATQPLFLTNGVRVANDALGVFLATASVAVAMSLKRSHLAGSTFGLGVLVGLAVLAKTVSLGLLPFVAACWVVAVYRDRDDRGNRTGTRKILASALALLIGFVIVTQSEFRANWQQFGSPTVMQEAVANRAAGRGTADLVRTVRVIPWRGWAEKLWFRDSLSSGGWSWAGKHEHLRSRHEFLAGLGLLGWAWLIVPAARARIFGLFRDPTCPLLFFILCMAYAGAMGYHAVQSQLCWGSIATNPWYAAAAYPWFLLLVSGGAFAWPAGRLRPILPAAIVLVFLEVEACTVLGSMTALYAGLAPWGEAVRRLAYLQPAIFGPTTLYAAIAGTLVFAALAILAIASLRLAPSAASTPPPRPRIATARTVNISSKRAGV